MFRQFFYATAAPGCKVVSVVARRHGFAERSGTYLRNIARGRVPCSATRVILRATWLGATLVLLAACESDEDEPHDVAPAASALYVASGEDSDGRISIAVVVDGQRVIGYACGDDPNEDDYTGWFYGKLGADGRFVLKHRGWTLDGAVTDGQITGLLAEPDRPAISWSGARANGADLTGLYVADDSGCETGVIVMDDGDPSTPPLVQGAWCDDMGLELPVTPILPIELIQERLAVHIMHPSAPRRLLTMPVIDRSGLLQVKNL